MPQNWLKPFIKASNIASQEALADEINVSRSTINRLANDHGKLRRGRAEELAAILRCSVEDLMLGQPGTTTQRERLIDSFDPDDETEVLFDTTAAYSREHWMPTIEGALPEVDTRLGAGSGTIGPIISLTLETGTISGHEVIAEWVIPLSYLRNEAKASPKDTLVMEVIGDSMQPTYMPGDRVLVDLSQNEMSADTVYAISDGQMEPQIKRLQRIPFTKPNQVKIISDNPSLETFTVELKQLTIIGRICGHISRK